MIREINRDKLLENLETLINTLEYDASRSAGKMKVAADQLVAAYELLDRYTAKKSGPKPTPKKEG